MSYNPSIAIPPGWTLSEQLDGLGMTQKELAQRLGMAEKTISEIINGEQSLTYETAEKLETVLGIPASFWNNAEKSYREDKARIETKKTLIEDKEILKSFSCYANLVKSGYVTATTKREEKILQLRKFLGVTKLGLIPDVLHCTLGIAFRKSDKHTTSIENLACWFRIGEIEANKQKEVMNITEYKKSAVKEVVSQLKELTKDEKHFDKDKIQKILNSVGIFFTITDQFKQTPVNGVARYIGDNPLIQMSYRYKHIDSLRFTLFHEIGHVINHLGKKNPVVELEEKNTSNEETQANHFASKNLVDGNFYTNLLKKQNITLHDLQCVAEENGVGVNIVAGRIAHDLQTQHKNIWKLTSSLRPSIK